MSTEVSEELFDSKPYEMYYVRHPEYSHVIIHTLSDEVIAYQDRFTGVWDTTDNLVETRPESMNVEYPISYPPVEEFDKDRLIKILGSDDSFLTLL